MCLKDPTVYCRLHRYEGQMLYFGGAVWYLLFLAAMLVTAALAGLFSHDWGVFCPKWAQTTDPTSPVCFAVNTDFMGALGQMGQDFDITGRNFSQVGVFLALSGLLTLAMPSLGAFLTVRILKWQLGAGKKEEIAVYLLGQSVDHSPICSTLFDAFVDKEEVMITMADRKVYVGYIMDVGPYRSDGCESGNFAYPDRQWLSGQGHPESGVHDRLPK